MNQGRIFTPFVGDKGMIVSPSLYGGANWPPSSYDPARQLLFVCASDVTGNFIGGDRDFEIPPDGQHYEGGVVGFAPLPRTGIFAAVDVTTNTLAWRYRWPEQCYSGSLATAGGLVFVGRNDGRLTALDSDTGLALWQFQTGAGMNAPTSTFEHDGKQYVVGLSAGNVLVGAPRGDSVWLFGLDGTLPPAAARDTESRTTAVPPPAPGERDARARRSRRRRSLQAGVRRVPRRGRHRRARRRRAARPSQRSRARHDARSPTGAAACRRSAGVLIAGADPRRRGLRHQRELVQVANEP